MRATMRGFWMNGISEPETGALAIQVVYFTRTRAGNTRVPSNVTPGSESRFTSRRFGSPARNATPASVTPLHSYRSICSSEAIRAKDLQAAVGDLCEARVVVLEREAFDMRRRDVGRLAAVHAREALQARAVADVDEALVGDVDGRELAQRGKRRQQRQRVRADMLQLTPRPRSDGMRRERGKSSAPEVRTFAPPQGFERLRAAERLEARRRSRRFPAPATGAGGNRRDVPHRRVAAQLAVGAEHLEVGKAAEMREPVRGDGRHVPEQIQFEEAVEAGRPAKARRP